MSGVKRARFAVLFFVLPALLVYLVAVFVPIVQSVFFSLFSWDGIFSMEFVGAKNYAHMFLSDSTFWLAFGHSMVFLAINIVIEIGIGLLIATLLLYVTKGRNLVKTLFFTPTVITTVAISFLFQNVYSMEPLGMVNSILSFVGLRHLATPWLSNLSTALVAVSLPEGWRFMGLFMIILYAGLVGLPNDTLEAARIDGAGEVKLFFHIRLPMLTPVLYVALIMSTTYALRGFDIPYLLTNGGPGQVTELITTYMYRLAFTQLQYGYASAVAVVIIVECVLLVVAVRSTVGRLVEVQA